MDEEKIDPLVGVTADVVSAYVSNNSVPFDQLPSLIGSIHQSLANLATGEKPAVPEPPKPAVPIKKSVTPDFIICLEDGRRFKSLKRHLATRYGMTPGEYRAKWNLPSNYPMIAPNYAATRSALAKQLGLGRKPKAAAAPPGSEEGPAPGGEIEMAAAPVSAKPRRPGSKVEDAPQVPVTAKRRTRKKSTG